MKYRHAIIHPKDGAVMMTDDNIQANVAQILGNKIALNPRVIFNWANEHNIELIRVGHILSKTENLTAFILDVLDNRLNQTEKLIK